MPVMDSSTPRPRQRFTSAARVLRLATMLLLLAGAFVALPWLLYQDSKRPAFCDPPEGLQALLESGAFHTSTDASIQALIPFTHITFSRGPCFGHCPVYRMVLHRNGQLEQLDEAGVNHRGSVGLETVARVAQLLQRAQAAATRREYLAGWTDDFTVEITAASPQGDWRVSDYGEVAPVEVWALEQVLHAIYLSTDWKAEPPLS